MRKRRMELLRTPHDVHVLMLTVLHKNEIRQELQTVSNLRILSKPFDPEDVLESVKLILNELNKEGLGS
ncbi:MAG: hypothetical protein CEE38_22060 [Planctomycetes bacterium B3_Pla]|nr:MAG: hypothetical protein CEE38_22060 [Planctomycetes bacterium B3_Pla]